MKVPFIQLFSFCLIHTYLLLIISLPPLSLLSSSLSSSLLVSSPLSSQGVVTKPLIRLYGAVSLVLAAKSNDPHGDELKVTMEVPSPPHFFSLFTSSLPLLPHLLMHRQSRSTSMWRRRRCWRWSSPSSLLSLALSSSLPTT